MVKNFGFHKTEDFLGYMSDYQILEKEPGLVALSRYIGR
jgi:hypothetical protein